MNAVHRGPHELPVLSRVAGSVSHASFARLTEAKKTTTPLYFTASRQTTRSFVEEIRVLRETCRGVESKGSEPKGGEQDTGRAFTTRLPGSPVT